MLGIKKLKEGMKEKLITTWRIKSTKVFQW